MIPYHYIPYEDRMIRMVHTSECGVPDEVIDKLRDCHLVEGYDYVLDNTDIRDGTERVGAYVNVNTLRHVVASYGDARTAQKLFDLVLSQ